MTANNLPNHPLFTDPDLGNEIWWLKIKNEKTPLFHIQSGKFYVIFVWKVQHLSDQIWIDVYCQSLMMKHPWQPFNKIDGTNIAYYSVELKHTFSSSYTIIEETNSEKKIVRNRTWWIKQLNQNSRIDPFNPQPPYQSSRQHWVNQFFFANHQIHFKNQNVQDNRYSNKHLKNSFQVHRIPDLTCEITHKDYAIQIFSNKNQTNISSCHSLLIFLDGQLWLQPALNIHNELATYDAHSTQSYCYVFISTDVQNRSIDYTCNHTFSRMLVKQIIPYIQQYCGLHHIKYITLIGQSLGGLCALYTQLHFPDVISHVIAQSPSLWWSDFSQSKLSNAQESPYQYKNFAAYWFKQISSSPLVNLQPLSVLLSAGTLETSIQNDASLFNQQFHTFSSEELKEKFKLRYQKFNGAHDPVHWREDLISILKEHISPS